jgi:MFS family permease
MLILLVLGSVGMAMLEPTTEAYFFDITSKEEKDRFYGIYNTTITLNHAVSIFIVSILIKFFPFKYSFLIIGFFMLIFAILSLKTKNIIENQRRN